MSSQVGAKRGDELAPSSPIITVTVFLIVVIVCFFRLFVCFLGFFLELLLAHREAVDVD